MPIISVRGIIKNFPSGSAVLQVLKNISLEVKKGEILSIIGPSGAGKSTLLHILGLLDYATGGQVFFKERDIEKLSHQEQAQIRNTTFGFVFQFYYLIPELTTLENIILPYTITYSWLRWWKHKNEVVARARDLATKLGLSERLHHKPGQLSGGEKQRVAIARALIHNPEIVFCDEPTGNLDKAANMEIQELILKLNAESGKTFIIVTHDETIAQKAHRVIKLLDGQII